MAIRPPLCPQCSTPRTSLFHPLCEHFSVCAHCIAKYLDQPSFSISCDNCDFTYDHSYLRHQVKSLQDAIEASLGCSLGLDAQCSKCGNGMRDEVVFPCKKHRVCFRCFETVVEESLRCKKLLRCSGEPVGSCQKAPFYDLSEFEGRLREPQIRGYEALVLRKSKIDDNERSLNQLATALYENLYGNELLDAPELSAEYKQIPEYLNSLAGVLQQIAVKANLAEFGVKWKTQEIQVCGLLDCYSKAHSYRNLQVGGVRLCSVRCLKMHYAQLPRGQESLNTKSGQVLAKQEIAQVIDVESRSEVKACMMCYESFLSEELPSHTSILEATGAPCGHPLCWKCLKEHLHALITTRAVSDEQFKCPDPRCQGKFAPQVVQQAFPRGNLFDLFLQHRFELMTNLASNEIKVMCPQTSCQMTYITEKPGPSARTRCVVCPHCHSKACSDCFLNYHPAKTCAEFRQTLNSLEG